MELSNPATATVTVIAKMAKLPKALHLKNRVLRKAR
jgi:hypothetical protein